MKKIKAALALFSAAILFCAPAGISVSANSAPAYWKGSESSGVVTGAQCPIEVEKETLTFDIPDFPQNNYLDGEALASYRSKVTAEYVFYNPTDEDVDLTLLFPLGTRPSYIGEDVEDLERYAVTVDGEKAETTLRHSYKEYDFAFDVDEDTGRVRESYAQDDFFSPDLPVVFYDYTVELPADVAQSGDLLLQLTFELNPSKTRIIAPNARNYSVVNGKTELSFRIKDNGSTYGFWMLGREVEAVVGVFDAYTDEEISEECSVTLKKGDESTFAELVKQTEESPVSEIDLYNISVDYLNESLTSSGVYYAYRVEDANYYMRWFEYSLTVPAGSTVVNAVSAPLYPAITNSNYRYEYYLSPAQKWADFKEIEININTSYRILYSSLDFTEGDQGYTLTRNSLPQGELTFSMFETENYAYGSGSTFSDAGEILMTAAIVLIAVSVLGGIVAAIVVPIVTYKKK